MSSQRYNFRDQRPTSINKITPRKRTSSEGEANNSTGTSNSTIDSPNRIISPSPANKRLRSEPDKVNETDQNLVDLPFKFLTPENLLQVLEYVPLNDRKNVRLTCELWHELCAHSSVTAREKFVFRASCSIDDVTKVLLESTSVKMNLEFHTPLVNSLSAEMWEKFGCRVHKINCYPMCSLELETIKNVILHCANLTSLKLYTLWLPSHLSSKMLDFLIDEGVERRQLSTFATFHRSQHQLIPSPDVLERIFRIFPRVKRFCVRNYFRIQDRDFGLERTVLLSGTRLLLKLPTQLESLEYNVLTDDSWLEKPMIPVWDTRLTKFEAMLTKKPEDEARIFQFFAIQKELKSVSLWLSEDMNQDGEFTKKLMFHVLEQCPKLREFRMNYRCVSLLLTTKEYSRFLVLISKLKVLSIDFLFKLESALTLSLMNFNLNAVSIAAKDDNSASSPCDLWKILTNCSRVQHLEITNKFDDQLLQRIFKNMLDLKTLILYCDNRCTNFGFTGQDSTRDDGYSIKRLQHLEHLELKVLCSRKRLDIVEISREFQFPRLKHLRLYVNLLRADTICQITSNTPELETLILSRSPRTIYLKQKQMIKFCKLLKNLKFLHVGIRFEKSGLVDTYTNTIEPLFKACPSLRYVEAHDPDGDVESRWNPSRFVFSFNPFSKKGQLEELAIPFYFPGRERFTMFKNKNSFDSF